MTDDIDQLAATEASANPHQRAPWRRALVPVIVFLSGLLLGLTSSFVAERQRNQVMRGVTFEERNLSGLDPDRVRSILQEKADGWARKKLSLAVGSAKFELAPVELGLEPDVRAMTQAAFEAGRQSTCGGFGFWLKRLFTNWALPLQLRIHREQARTKLLDLQRQALPSPPQPAIVWNHDLQVTYPEASVSINADAALAALPIALTRDWPPLYMVPLHRREASLSKTEVDARVAEARRLLAAPIRLSHAALAEPLILQPMELGQALGSSIELDPKPRLVLNLSSERLQTAWGKVRPQLERPARSVRFVFDSKGKATIVPREIGVRIDEAGTLEEVLLAAARPDRAGEIRLRTEQPEGPTEAEAEALGIKQLVAKFTTHHACCEPRVKNIQSVARQLDGHILRPGQEFSLNQLLGPRTREGGYVEAPTIVRGKMKQTSGGGISQFATTLFNAVLNGGYQIIQRQPHSFYFPRYPEGHEATVSYPSPDLMFKNDTKYGMVLKTEFGPTFISVLIYGDNEGRRVERRLSPRFNLTPPPLQYEPAPELSPEKTRLVTRGQTGWTVTATRVVFFSDGTEATQSRDVVYQPRPQIVQIHPCNIPTGMRGHTGEPCPELPAGQDAEPVAAPPSFVEEEGN